MDLLEYIRQSYRGKGSSVLDTFAVFSKDSTNVSSSAKVILVCCCFLSEILIDFPFTFGPQIWIAIVIVIITSVILISVFLWRKKKIRSKFSD
jgi:Flp pilus assembly protein TadB